MIVILPVRTLIKLTPVWVLMFLMLLLFFGGLFLGITAIWFFTAPKVLTTIHLWTIPVALVVGVVMVGFGRQMVKNGPDRGGFFAIGELWPSLVFFLTLLSLGGGLWSGAVDGLNMRSYRLREVRMRARALELAAQHKNLTFPRPPEQTLRLQAIFYNQKSSSAIINNKTVLVGESVAGQSVTAIESKSVTLRNASGETNTLFLK